MHFPDKCLLHDMEQFPALQGLAVVLHKQEKHHGPAMRGACTSPGTSGHAVFSVPWWAGRGIIAAAVSSSSLCCFLTPSSFGGMPHRSLVCRFLSGRQGFVLFQDSALTLTFLPARVRDLGPSAL